jgi:NAD(P)-dependent dehydrogenase (short-subunit alcohol dehydrogenase family)
VELRDRVTIITGAGSGIGRAVAQRFAAEGARRVVCADLNEANAVATAEEIGPVARGVGLDVADEAAVQALVADVEAADGPIDVFFSNAGYGLPGGLDVPNEEWVRMMDVHFMSHLYAARAVVPSMVARGEGYILSTASAAGLLTQMDSAPYAVTKHAAVAFAEWLAINYGDQGIRVSCLCPQAVRTNIIGDDLAAWNDRANQAALDGILEPEDVAQAIVDTMAAERFLVLPHPEVATYFQRKASDYDRWLAGMRRYRARLAE